MVWSQFPELPEDFSFQAVAASSVYIGQLKFGLKLYKKLMSSD